jgi:signal peptidase I
MQRRKAFLALLASLGTPGLGQLYNGRLRKAALMYGLQCALPGIGTAFPPAESFAHLVILVLLLICIPLLVIVDAIRDARRSGEVPLHRYNRWYVYLAVLLVHGLVIGPAFVRFSGLPDLKAFKVHGTSMTPSLVDGDRIVVDLAAYSRNHPKRGDVVAFTMPPDESKLYLKRVLGLPGERIDLTEKGVLVNGTPLEDPWGHYADSGKTDMRRFSPVFVPEGRLFLLGDSRNDSHDSKFYGPVEESQVLGKARYLYWSKKTERIGKKLD